MRNPVQTALDIDIALLAQDIKSYHRRQPYLRDSELYVLHFLKNGKQKSNDLPKFCSTNIEYIDPILTSR